MISLAQLHCNNSPSTQPYQTILFSSQWNKISIHQLRSTTKHIAYPVAGVAETTLLIQLDLEQTKSVKCMVATPPTPVLGQRVDSHKSVCRQSCADLCKVDQERHGDGAPHPSLADCWADRELLSPRLGNALKSSVESPHFLHPVKKKGMSPHAGH